ncbi:MAG: hypothetical protein QXX94_00530 [Candidatus Bathyarchaeia archaeon]
MILGNYEPRNSDEKIGEFGRIVVEAVDDGLSVFGETVKATLLLLIKERFHIDNHEISEKPKEFSSALRSILGNGGGKFVENLIVRNLYAKLGLGAPEVNKEFHEYIFEARRKTTLI